jgi:hypothetical protein
LGLILIGKMQFYGFFGLILGLVVSKGKKFMIQKKEAILNILMLITPIYTKIFMEWPFFKCFIKIIVFNMEPNTKLMEKSISFV